MHGQLVPVFVAGKLMGFRRKKNDRLLMFILRHYGTDANGRRTTINYFSTRATAGAQNSSPAFAGEGDRVKRGGGAADPSVVALAKAEASTTTVKTVISGPANAADPLAADTDAANLINAFEGVALDEEAQAEIYRALEACAERRRALDDPDNDPQCDFVRVAPGDVRWLGELESGAGGEDWVEYRPEGEHAWDNLGEGGNAAEIDEVVAGIEARRAAMTPEERAAEAEADRAAVEAQRAQQQRLPAPEPDPADPRLDWRNYDDNGYAPPTLAPPRNGEGDHAEHGGGAEGFGPACPGPRSGEGLPSDPLRNGEGDHVQHGGGAEGLRPDPGAKRTHKPRKPYKKRQSKPPFIPPDEARKAQAVADVEAERREAATAEARRRKRRGAETMSADAKRRRSDEKPREAGQLPPEGPQDGGHESTG
jgi:hypothetical protein